MSLEFERVLFRRSVLLVNVAPPSVDNPNEILSSPVIFENEKTYTFLAEISEEAIAKFGWNFLCLLIKTEFCEFYWNCK